MYIKPHYCNNIRIAPGWMYRIEMVKFFSLWMHSECFLGTFFSLLSTANITFTSSFFFIIQLLFQLVMIWKNEIGKMRKWKFWPEDVTKMHLKENLTLNLGVILSYLLFTTSKDYSETPTLLRMASYYNTS